MITPKQLERLNAMEDFRCLLDSIYEMREGEIAALASLTSAETVPTRIGTINAYQVLLDMAGYRDMLKRERN